MQLIDTQIAIREEEHKAWREQREARGERGSVEQVRPGGVGVALESRRSIPASPGQRSARHDWINVHYPFSKDQRILVEQQRGFELELPGDYSVAICRR